LEWLWNLFVAYGDIFQVCEPITRRTAVVLCNPEHIHHVLVRNFTNYQKGRDIERVALLMGKGLFAVDGDRWRKQRHLIQPAFQKHRLAHLVPMMSAANQRLGDRWVAAAVRRDSVDVTFDTSVIALELVLTAIFGPDLAGVQKAFSMLSERPERNLKFARDFCAVDHVIVDAIQRRRKEGVRSADLLDYFLAACSDTAGEPMPDHQIVTEIKTLVVAGHETTAATMAWLWHLVAGDGDVALRLCSESKDVIGERTPEIGDVARLVFTKHVVEETLRLYPVGWIFTRRSRAPDTIGKYYIPKDTEIYISPYIVHRHPRYWEDPTTFNPLRFQRPDANVKLRGLAFMPFGAGPRVCIGEHMAMLELIIHACMIARRVELRARSGDYVELDPKINLRSKNHIVLTPTERSHTRGG
jgi:cytochrome P450